MFVFREGRRVVRAQELLDSLASGLQASSPHCADALDLLLRAGELECALADRHSSQAVRLAALTDALAAKLVAGRALNAPQLLRTLRRIEVPEQVSISPPEGFTYYALHPLNYADLVMRMPVKESNAAIVGIRSIGTTLGAIVAAALAQRGIRAERTTVRPQGHPFDRVTQFTGEQLRWVETHQSRAAHFFVVDEGPGLSGSSMLSVAEALVAASVPAEHITFLCSREADVSKLVARDAVTRWARYRVLAVAPNNQLPSDAELYVGGGIWRAHFIGDENAWPASWLHVERLKFLSRDRRRLYKFEGLGRFGAEVRERTQALADGGFAVPADGHQQGLVAYPVNAGRVLGSSDLSTELLDHLARYCAFRAVEFRVARPPTPLHEMVEFNVAQEFGMAPDIAPEVFATPRPVITDSHLLPYEWLRTPAGRLLKLDGVSHGDDHFYPGPTDIAWDLAGAIVEWNLPPAAQDHLLGQYRRASGDDPTSRLRSYLLAYAMFRLGFCKMAAGAMSGCDEEPRLVRAYRFYRAAAQAQLGIRPDRLAAD